MNFNWFLPCILIIGLSVSSCNTKSISAFSQNETPGLESAAENIKWEMKDNIFAGIAMKTDDRIKQIRKRKINLIFLDENGNRLPDNTQIKVRQVGHEFLFGSFVSEGKFLTDPEYKEYQKYFTEIFNFATIGFYWFNNQILFKDGNFETGTSDRNISKCLEYCKKHNITVKGHPLAWNYKDPVWLKGSSEEVFNILKLYASNRVETYKNRIKIWDAVNEAAEYNEGTRPELAPLMTKMIEQTGVPVYVNEMCKTAKNVDTSNIIIMNEATPAEPRRPPHPARALPSSVRASMTKR